MNVGGEPDRDDFGLPPVDIEIPDDARELDRDVQAYRRELRALRRQKRMGRLHVPLSRDGLVLPLLAGFLAMVLISGVLLTLFSAGQSGTPHLSAPSGHPTRNASIGAGTTPPASQSLSQLPDAKVVTASGEVRLRSLFSTVLALVPPGCRCRAVLRHLGNAATAAGVSLYFVGTAGDMRQVRRLAAAAPQPGSQVADDAGNVLARTYRARGLTAVLVRADDSVETTVRDITVRDAEPGSPLAGKLRSLAPAP